MRYVAIVLFLLGFTNNLFADEAQPVEIPGYTPPNFSTKPTPSKSLPSTPSTTATTPTATAPTATTSTATTSAATNMPQQNAQAMMAKQATALRQCQPQTIDPTQMLANAPNRFFTKMMGSNFTFKITILGPNQQGACHIVTTMTVQGGPMTNGQPSTGTLDCLVPPNVIEDAITMTQLTLRDKQAGQPPQADTKQLSLKFMQEYLQSCNITFDGKQMTLPPEVANPVNSQSAPQSAPSVQPQQQPIVQTPAVQPQTQQPTVETPPVQPEDQRPAVQAPSVQPQIQQPAQPVPQQPLPQSPSTVNPA